ncbi:MAG: hypothetical protein QOI11_3528 [Candidatus Eremiobacteraeota bacterium]|nr:hypothetical protein [Candidatus Eremiobacteraeota bacterium]
MLRVAAPRSLGRGVAYPIESAGLSALYAELAHTWSAWLTAQDRQRFAPHVVVQNKVDPETTRRTLADLGATAEFSNVCATGNARMALPERSVVAAGGRAVRLSP